MQFIVPSLLADRTDQALRSAAKIARLPLPKPTCSVSDPGYSRRKK